MFSSTGPVLTVSERYWAGTREMLRLMEEMAASDRCHHTIYLRAESTGSPGAPLGRSGASSADTELAGVLRQVGESDTGVVLFWGDERAWAVVPPFPIDDELSSTGANIAPLVELLGRDLHVGVVLLRLGRYSVGVLRRDKLLASKSGSRYVKSRHRAGGSSQRRFERSRQRLVRELFDKVCQVAQEAFAPFDDRIDYLLLGGERHTLQRFIQRCPLLERWAPVTLGRRLEVQRPGQAAMEQVHRGVWRSRVLVFTRGEST